MNTFLLFSDILADEILKVTEKKVLLMTFSFC